MSQHTFRIIYTKLSYKLKKKISYLSLLPHAQKKFVIKRTLIFLLPLHALMTSASVLTKKKRKYHRLIVITALGLYNIRCVPTIQVSI